MDYETLLLQKNVKNETELARTFIFFCYELKLFSIRHKRIHHDASFINVTAYCIIKTCSLEMRQGESMFKVGFVGADL